MGIKLSAKFARQESEQARLARIARKLIPTDRIETIRRMLGLPKSEREACERRRDGNATLFVPSVIVPSPFRCIWDGIPRQNITG